MSRWLVTLALACFVALAAPRAEAQVFKPRNGAPAKGTPTKAAAADKPAAKADRPSDKKVAAADKPDKPAAKKRTAAKKAKKKKSDDDDDTVTVEDDDVKISDD